MTTTLHMGFGTAIRNEFGLWSSNGALMQSSKKNHPDDCSTAILEQLWESIRRDADPQLVHDLDCKFALVERIRIEHREFGALRRGEVLESLKTQIERQLESPSFQGPTGCEAGLVLRTENAPNPECFVRCEVCADPPGSASLNESFEWFSWRNAFEVRYTPPSDVTLVFNEQCAWPKSVQGVFSSCRAPAADAGAAP